MSPVCSVNDLPGSYPLHRPRTRDPHAAAARTNLRNRAVSRHRRPVGAAHAAFHAT